MPVGAGNDEETKPAMTVFVTPDAIGRLCCRKGDPAEEKRLFSRD